MNGRQNPNQNPAPRQNQRPPQRKKKKYYFRPNKEGMQALLILVLIAALIITLLVLTIKGIASAIGGPEETTTAETTTAETTTEAPVVVTWHDDYVKKAVPSTDVAVGDLILVNFENAYPLTDSITKQLSTLYGSDGYGEYFVLGIQGSDTKVRRDILPNLRTMITDLVDASPALGTTKEHDRVVIASGYRSTEYQQGLFDKQAVDNYVAIPGHSEHHTGLAVDLKVFTAKEKTVEFREDEQAWMEANCANYGFIVRYDGAKFELTGILDETWHFRYVGKPHAQYMSENGLCLEEYLSLLRTTYNFDTCDAPLTYITGEGEEATTYEIYYYPASADVNTDIFVPKAGTYSDISISGDNMNGFIVTVTK
ncbi:MAG: M15 family metallopeptidase [Clostridia bacterium]|nr:M15 family metallopeptidase [Clostridia bacterium]